MSINIESAMVLAAGLGLRMRPLTNDRPKALVEVCGRSLIDRILDRLAQAGVRRAVINLHYLPHMLREHLSSRQDLDIVFSDESDCLLDTGGGLKRAHALFGNAPIFTHNCDTLWIEDGAPVLQKMKDVFDPAAMDALLLLAPRADASGYEGRGDFFLHSGGTLSWRGREEKAPFVWTGVQIFHPQLLNTAPEGPFSALNLLDKALLAGRLFGVELDGKWMHVGDPAGLMQAEALLKNGST